MTGFTDRYGTELSTLMGYWVVWAREACGDPDWRQDAQTYIDRDLAEDPENLTSGLAYLLALVGDTEQLVDLMWLGYERRNPLTLALGTFRLQGMGWEIEDSLPQHPRYVELLERLDLPPMTGLP